MSFTNAPLFTAAALIDYVTPLIGASSEVTTTAVENALRHAIMGNGTRLASKYYITFPIDAVGCEIDISAYSIDKIDLVERSCGTDCDDCDGLLCYTPVHWWRTQDNRLILEGREYLANIRITYRESPALITDAITVRTDMTPTVDVELPLEWKIGFGTRFDLPTSGYIMVGLDPPENIGTQWLEYRGIRMPNVFAGDGGVILLGVQYPPFVQNDPLALNPVSAGVDVHFGVPMPSAGHLDATIKQAGAAYWGIKTGQCTNEDERSTAMQLMNYWQGEADKAWRNIPSSRKGKKLIQRVPGEQESQLTWPFPS